MAVVRKIREIRRQEARVMSLERWQCDCQIGQDRLLPWTSFDDPLQARRHTTKDRRELNKVVDADYYGYRDDEDGALVPAEAEAEMAAIQAALDEWKEQQVALGLDPDTILAMISSSGPSASSDSARAMEEHFTSHLQLPSREEMEQMLIERRKQALLAAYIHDD